MRRGGGSGGEERGTGGAGRGATSGILSKNLSCPSTSGELCGRPPSLPGRGEKIRKIPCGGMAGEKDAAEGDDHSSADS